VLPEYSSDASSHLYHTWELVEELSHRLKLFIFIEKAKEPPGLKSADYIYIQKFNLLPLRLIERFIVFLWARLRGYREFYVHISHFSAILAAMVARHSGGRVYYWYCGLRSVSVDQQRKMGAKIRQKLFNEYAFRFNLKVVNFLVTGTPSMANYYWQNFGISMRKIKVIPNSINLARFQSGNHNPAEFKKEMGITENNKMVLFVHWLSERKGAHYLAAIIKEVTAKIPNAVFIIVGDGPYRGKLIQEINDTGLDKYVKLTGGVPNAEIAKYYAIADLFIMPSTDEGFPRVLLEAMAMGVPFVATDVGGVRDILTKRQMEFITPVGDVAAFNQKVINLLGDDKLREELKAEGLRKVAEFDRQAVAELFYAMIVRG